MTRCHHDRIRRRPALVLTEIYGLELSVVVMVEAYTTTDVQTRVQQSATPSDFCIAGTSGRK